MLFHGIVDIFAERQSKDFAFESFFIAFEPCGSLGYEHIRLVQSREHNGGAAAFLDFYLITNVNDVRRDVDFLSVYGDVSVAYKLLGFVASLGKAKAVYNVVQTRLEQLEHYFASNARLSNSHFVVKSELALKNSVDKAELLLFVKLKGIFRLLSACLFLISFAYFGMVAPSLRGL